MTDYLELLADVADIYFETDKVTPLHPPTRLYPLEPFSVGTASCESLKSYFLRLADAHSISPTSLHNLVLVPLLAEQCRSWKANCFLSSRMPGAYNGFGLMANTLANALAESTSVEKIRFCCLGGIEHLLSWQRLFREKVMFCPACIEETSDYKKYFQRLLWTVSAVEVCPIHKITLVEQVCGHNANEKRSRQKKVLFGICPHCGSVGYTCNTARWSVASAIQIWRAAQVGELIAQSPSTFGILSKESVKKGIASVANDLGRGYLTPAAQAAGLNKSVLWGWLNNKCNPTLHLLLNLCGAANVSLLSVMKGNPVQSNQLGAGILKREVTAWRLPKPSQKAREDTLREALLAEVPKSVPFLAKELGITTKTLRRDFSTLVQQVAARWKQHGKDVNAVIIEKAHAECRKAILELKRDGRPITHRNLEAHLGKNILPKDPLYKAFQVIVSNRK